MIYSNVSTYGRYNEMCVSQKMSTLSTMKVATHTRLERTENMNDY